MADLLLSGLASRLEQCRAAILLLVRILILMLAVEQTKEVLLDVCHVGRAELLYFYLYVYSYACSP